MLYLLVLTRLIILRDIDRTMPSNKSDVRGVLDKDVMRASPHIPVDSSKKTTVFPFDDSTVGMPESNGSAYPVL